MYRTVSTDITTRATSSIPVSSRAVPFFPPIRAQCGSTILSAYMTDAGSESIVSHRRRRCCRSGTCGSPTVSDNDNGRFFLSFFPPFFSFFSIV